MIPNMTNNDRWFWIIIGAVTGVGVFAWLVAMLVLTRGVEPKDWLNFIGILLGIALTPGAARLIEWQAAHFEDRRRRRDFVTAAKLMATSLEAIRTSDAAMLSQHARLLSSFWRVASGTINDLPILEMQHRVTIGIMQDMLNESVPVLTRNAQLVATNPGLATSIRTAAEKLLEATRAVIMVFEPRHEPAPVQNNPTEPLGAASLT